MSRINIYCDKVVFHTLGTDPVTGEKIIRARNGWDLQRTWNKKNNCPYFKKRIFAKENKKVFCINCRYGKESNFSGYFD